MGSAIDRHPLANVRCVAAATAGESLMTSAEALALCARKAEAGGRTHEVARY
jgi:hypothetical protein